VVIKAKSKAAFKTGVTEVDRTVMSGTDRVHLIVDHADFKVASDPAIGADSAYALFSLQ